MKIIEFVSNVIGHIFGPKNEKEAQLTPFGQYLASLGWDKVKDSMDTFKNSAAYGILYEYFRHAQRVARERMMTCDPEDHTTIAYCQAYFSLVTLFDGAVENLSLEELDLKLQEHLQIEDSIEII
jgi:hypothetical protein